jgi:mannose-6-phosphate isomerase-like protein (cupin superfamily)
MVDNAMTARAGPFRLSSTHLRLRTDGGIDPITVDQNFWPDLISGKFGDFKNEYLVMALSFDTDWPSWEQHPNGDEFVYLISGAVDFILDDGDNETTIELREPGEFVIVPKGAWHTAKVKRTTTMLFITAGEGTLNRTA